MDEISKGFFWIPDFRHIFPFFDTLYGRPFAVSKSGPQTYTARNIARKRASGGGSKNTIKVVDFTLLKVCKQLK
jgi:hypothetical protein